jgi:HSP20 family protein
MDMIEIHLGKEIDEMRDQMEQMVEEMCQLTRTFAPRGGASWAPPMDMYETPEEFIILVEMAGLHKEDIRVTVDQGVLRISGRRLNPIQDAQRRVHQMEVDFGPFQRTARMRTPILAEETRAIYREGFLLIRVPKAFKTNRQIRVEGVKP